MRTPREGLGAVPLDMESQSLLIHNVGVGGKQGGEASMFSSWFNVTNVTVGAGTLTIPYAFYLSGLGLGLAMLVALCFACAFSIRLLLWATNYAGKDSFSYFKLAHVAFGHRVALAIEAAIFLHCFAALLAYQVIIGDLVPPVLSSWADSSSRALSRGWVVGMVNLALVLPTSLPIKVSYLAHMSAVALVCIVYLVVLVIAHAVANGFDDMKRGNVNKRNLAGGKEIRYVAVSGRLTMALPIIAFAFASHVQIPAVYEELRDRSIRRMMSVVWASSVASAAVYGAIGLFGYVTFAQATDGNIFNNFTNEDNVAVGLAKIALALALALSIPLFVHPLRANVITLGSAAIGRPLQPPRWALSLLTVALLASSVLIALVIPNVEDILAFSGASVVSLLIYVFPAAVYLRLRPPTGKRTLKIGAIALLVWGLFTGVVGTAAVILDFLDVL